MNKEYRHELIQGEFRDALFSKERKLSLETDAVVALSGRSDYIHRERIKASIDTVRRINNIVLILNGTTEQLPVMERIVDEFGFKGKVILVDCGKEGNTLTQMQVLNNLNFNHITLVTNGFHAPRVRRTANMNLKTNFEVIAIPATGSIFRDVRSEIKKIKSYSEKGDISL